MHHIMIDLETLGVEQDAAIIAIGACFFDPFSGKIGDEFTVKIEWESAMEGRSISASTVKWWSQQSVEAQKGVTDGKHSMEQALRDFKYWAQIRASSTIRVWGNGATFDITLLENAFKQYKIDPFWAFWARVGGGVMPAS